MVDIMCRSEREVALVVSEDEGLNAVVCEQLFYLGYHVDTCRTAAEALSVLGARDYAVVVVYSTDTDWGAKLFA